MFDGTYQASFNLESEEGIAGFTVRFGDIFNHYGVIVDVSLKQVVFYSSETEGKVDPKYG